jgi:hypothetical protein
MKVKIFMDSNATQIEVKLNAWLENLRPGDVIKTETVLTAVAEKPNDGTRPCIVVTVWYDERSI